MSLLPPELINRVASRNVRLINHDQKVLTANGVETKYFNDGNIPMTQRFSGQQNPRHQHQLDQFIQAATPMVAWKDELINAESGVTETLIWNNWTSPTRPIVISLRGNFPTQSITDAEVESVSSAKASNLALSKLAQNIYSAHTAFQGSTFIGELRDTLKMLRSPAKTLRQKLPGLLNLYSKNVKRGTKRREANRIVNDTYLEWTFGVRPILNDISSAHALLNNLIQSSALHRDITLRGTGKVSTQLSSAQQSIGATAPFILGTRITSSEASVRFLAGYRLNENNFQQTPLKVLGLTPENWIPTAWELLPWSFVYDYFTNIGDIVIALANVTTSPRWIIKTIKLSHVRQTSFKGVQQYAFSPTGLYSGRAVDTNVQRGQLRHARHKVIRELYDGRSLVPSLEFEIPGLGMKWLNIAALGNALFSRRKSINQRLT